MGLGAFSAGATALIGATGFLPLTGSTGAKNRAFLALMVVALVVETKATSAGARNTPALGAFLWLMVFVLAVVVALTFFILDPLFRLVAFYI